MLWMVFLRLVWISSLVFAAVALVLGTPGTAPAATPTYIKNGLAPPNPENVIRGPDSERREPLVVRNRGCPDLGNCLVPLEPTTVHLVGALWYYYGGSASRSMLIRDSSSAAVFQGGGGGRPTFDHKVSVRDQASLLVNNGIFETIDFEGSSTGVIRGGVFSESIEVEGRAQVRVEGGDFTGRLRAYGAAHLTVEGGTIRDGFSAGGTAWVTITGGTPAGGYWAAAANDSSMIEFIGSDFAADGVPIEYGELPVPGGRLTGTLASGDPLDVEFRHQGELHFTGSIITGPEPMARADIDGDGTPDRYDNCVEVENTGQEDRDLDGVGDACNTVGDWDGDEYSWGHDTCPFLFDLEHADTDGNMRGDLCNDEFDRDGDEFEDENDVCPDLADPLQIDTDGDTRGDRCDQFPDDEFNLEAQPMLELATAQLASAEAERDQLIDALQQTETELDSVNAALAQAELDLAATIEDRDQAISAFEECLDNPPFLDADLDGEHDATDACPGTASGEAVDPSGCSADQFCASVVAHPGPTWLRCAGAHWTGTDSRSILCQYDPAAGSCVPRTKRWSNAHR